MSETNPSTPVAIPLPVAPVAARAKTNVLAIISLVSAILGGTALIAIIAGHIALGQIKRTGESGRVLALAGVIIGYIAIIFTLIWIAVVVAVSIAAGASGEFTVTE